MSNRLSDLFKDSIIAVGTSTLLTGDPTWGFVASGLGLAVYTVQKTKEEMCRDDDNLRRASSVPPTPALVNSLANEFLPEDERTWWETQTIANNRPRPPKVIPPPAALRPTHPQAPGAKRVPIDPTNLINSLEDRVGQLSKELRDSQNALIKSEHLLEKINQEYHDYRRRNPPQPTLPDPIREDQKCFALGSVYMTWLGWHWHKMTCTKMHPMKDWCRRTW